MVISIDINMLRRLISPLFWAGKRQANNAAWFVGIRDMTGAEMFSDFDDDTETATTTPKRPLGRPRGYPRSGGRAKGTPNKKNQVTRDYVIKEGAPLAFLCRVVRGKRFTAAAQLGDNKRVYIYPTLDQSLRAAEILSRKVLPDLKSTELTGKDGGAVALTLLDFLKELPA